MPLGSAPVLVAFALASVAALAAQNHPVVLDRLRYHDNATGERADHPDYPEWEESSVPTIHRDLTHITRVWEPPASAVTTIVFVAAGQQPLGGHPNCATGQLVGYMDLTKTGSAETEISSESLAGQLVHGGLLDPNTTFMALAFDAQFTWESPFKDHVLKAYTRWLTRHATPKSIKRVFLIGTSRGGALSLRLSRSLRDQEGWEDVPVHVGLIDAVPNVLAGEIETSLSQPRCQNPLNKHKSAAMADLKKFYEGVSAPDIRHTVTGSGAVLGFFARGLCADETLGWYNQTWANLGHTDISRCSNSNHGPYVKDMWDVGTGKIYDWVVDKLN